MHSNPQSNPKNKCAEVQTRFPESQIPNFKFQISNPKSQIPNFQGESHNPPPIQTPNMKTTLHLSRALLAGAAMLLTVPAAHASCYGVCRPAYHPAYHRDAAVVAGAAAGAAVANADDATWVDPNGTTQSGQTAPPPGVSPANVAPDVDVPMNGYVRTIPANYQTVTYQGYTCYLANGTYYRPIFYQGSTVYVVVTPSDF